jgi:glycosyltransferase involved in cell wall biosynthesis
VSSHASPTPFFSVLVTAYNRAESLERCLRSVREQTFDDFELVVVDDASTDTSPALLAAIDDPRLRVVRHRLNRGISPARATAVEHARGEWFVVLDSDWELYPHALARLRALIDERPAGVRIIRHRLACDGALQPGVMPSGVTGYEERLRWMEDLTALGTSADAGHCMHRSVLEKTNFFPDRRGSQELLWETELARSEPSLWVDEVLATQHLDAAHSHSRDARASRLVPRLLRDARDSLWMAETMLTEHGEQLARHAPQVRRLLLERAAIQAFLSGQRRTGLRHALGALSAGSSRPKVIATLGLGLLGPRALAYAHVPARRRQVLKAAR